MLRPSRLKYSAKKTGDYYSPPSCLLCADWIRLGHNWRGSLRIDGRPPDACLAWPVVIHLMDVGRWLHKRISSVEVVHCWLARFIFKNAAAPFQDHPGRAVMMMPPGTVTRFQSQLLNLYQARPRAAGKDELADRTGNRVLKAKRKYGTRHSYAETDCSFPFPVHFLCSFRI
jgi:hypothetical protein